MLDAAALEALTFPAEYQRLAGADGSGAYQLFHPLVSSEASLGRSDRFSGFVSPRRARGWHTEARIHGIFSPADWRRVELFHQPRWEAGCETRTERAPALPVFERCYDR